MTKSDKSLEHQNQEYHLAQDRMRLLPNYYLWMYRRINKYIRGSVVELGCGSGLGIRTYVDKATKVYAVDYNEVLLKDVDIQFSNNKVTTIHADLRGNWDELVNLGADTIIMMDVLEHFSDDLNFLSKAKQSLKPGGIIVVKIPAQRALFSEMDEASGHYRRYDPEDLIELGKKLDLKILSLKQVNIAGNIAYRFKNKQKKNFSRTFSPVQLKFINAAIPVISLMDEIPLLSGLSVICIYQKQ